MADHRIDTDKVSGVAKSLHQVNENLHQDFSSVIKAVNGLNNVWDGGAAWAAENAFNKIKNKYESQRYTVVENYVRFLTQQVGEGFVITEEANKSLADAFK